MRLLANDRSIVTKKAGKGLCLGFWDYEDYIAETSKQLNDKSVYKSVKFKDKILQGLLKKSHVVFKGLKEKVTEKQGCVLHALPTWLYGRWLRPLQPPVPLPAACRALRVKYFTIEQKKLPIWVKCIYFPRFIKGCTMFLEDQLYRIVEHLQKKPWNF